MTKKQKDGKSIPSARRIVIGADGETRDYSAAQQARYEALGPDGKRVTGSIDLNLTGVPPRFIATYVAAMFLKLDHARNGVVNGSDSRSVQDALDETYETIASGGWTHARGGDRALDEELVQAAFLRMRGGKAEKVAAWWAGLTEDQRKEQSKRPGIPETMQVIRGERKLARLAARSDGNEVDVPSFD